MLSEPAFSLYNKKGLGTKVFPKNDTSISQWNVWYHIRSWEHDLTLFDWMKYIEFIKNKINDNKINKN